MVITYHVISLRQGLHLFPVDFFQQLIQLDKTLTQVFWYINILDSFRGQALFKFLPLLDLFLPLFLSGKPVILFSKVKIFVSDMPFLKWRRDRTAVKFIGLEKFDDFRPWQFGIHFNIFNFKTAVSGNIAIYAEAVLFVLLIFNVIGGDSFHPYKVR